MPEGSWILSVGKQAGQALGNLTLWAAVDPTSNKVEHTINVRGTGHDLSDIPLDSFLGTVEDGHFVWHVFGRRSQP
jgi:hypothetical protein